MSGTVPLSKLPLGSAPSGVPTTVVSVQTVNGAPVTLGGGMVGSPAVHPAPTPVSGVWNQNTLNGDLDLCLPGQFGANQQASLYIGTTTVSAAPMDWVSTESVGGVFALKGRVPPGCFWALTTTGTINPSGYPSGAIKQ